MYVLIVGIAFLVTGCATAPPAVDKPAQPSTGQAGATTSANDLVGRWSGNMAIRIYNFDYDGPIEISVIRHEGQSIEGNFRCLEYCGVTMGVMPFKSVGTRNRLQFS